MASIKTLSCPMRVSLPQAAQEESTSWSRSSRDGPEFLLPSCLPSHLQPQPESHAHSETWSLISLHPRGSPCKVTQLPTSMLPFHAGQCLHSQPNDEQGVQMKNSEGEMQRKHCGIPLQQWSLNLCGRTSLIQFVILYRKSNTQQVTNSSPLLPWPGHESPPWKNNTLYFILFSLTQHNFTIKSI